MSDIIFRRSEWHSCGANIRGCTGAIRIRFDFVPKTIEITTSCMIIPDCIKRVGDPIASRRGIALKHSLRCNSVDHQVILDYISGLDTVFQENVMSFNFIAHILLNCQIVRSVDSQHSCMRVVNCNSSHETIGNLSGKMEMRTISSDYFGLAAAANLSVRKCCI